jgi:hydroxymethylbilane synthase
MKNRRLRIGSRGSELALWQARWIQRALLEHHPGLATTIDIIKTKGDRILDSPLSRIGDKGLFTREIEQALLRGTIDAAVHSLKDLPTELPPGLTIGAVCEREDVRDVFIPHPSNPIRTLKDQPRSAAIATGSLRRKCQVLHLRPDLTIVDIRGNLNTRIKKLGESPWHGMLLAKAGVLRLGWMHVVGETMGAETVLPAVGQGALGVEIRVGDEETADLLAPLEHQSTRWATTAERALLRTLEGGCQVPIGAHARIEGAGSASMLVMDAMIGSLDGGTVLRGRATGAPAEAEAVGVNLAGVLLRKGADRILREIRETEGRADEPEG